MECINHPGSPAAGTCQQCGKALCAECLNRFDPPMCDPCFVKNNDVIMARYYRGLAITAVIFLGVSVFCMVQAPQNKSAGILVGLFFACAYWGWQFLGRFSVPILFTSGFGLLTYYLFKFMAAVCVGIFVTPVQIYRAASDIRLMHNYKKLVEQEQAQRASRS